MDDNVDFDVGKSGFVGVHKAVRVVGVASRCSGGMFTGIGQLRSGGVV